jgi:hypothetical protein
VDGDRNGGFSRADFAQLYLPPLMDPVYGFQAVNVEAQLRTPTSLLRWLQPLHRAAASSIRCSGSVRTSRSATSNPRIFAHVRQYEDDVVLCVHNVARSAQAVELDLSRFSGMVPEEMFGRTAFPAIGDLSYLLRSRRAGFFWFQLARRGGEASDGVHAPSALSVPRSRSAIRARAALVRREVARDRARPRSSRAPSCGPEEPLLALALAEIRFHPGRTSSTTCRSASGASGRRDRRGRGVGTVTTRSPTRSSRASSVRAMRSELDVRRARRWIEFGGARGSTSRSTSCGRSGREQSNSSLVFDDALMLKAYRPDRGGRNPELELLRFLTDRGFPSIAVAAGLGVVLAARRVEATLGDRAGYLPARVTAGSSRSARCARAGERVRRAAARARRGDRRDAHVSRPTTPTRLRAGGAVAPSRSGC